MSKWEKVRLGDVVKISSGGTPSKNNPEYYKNGTIPWVRTGDLKEKYIFDVETRITEKALRETSVKLFPSGTVLIAMYGATIGACSILAIEAATNQACAAMLPNNKVDCSYLYYFLRSKKNDLIKMSVGGAQPNISAKILKDIKLTLPPLETQKQIAKTLDTASELLALRKQQFAELDQLIKSVFYDMFGDPVVNDKGWSVSRLKEITTKIGSGATPRGGKESYQNEGISLIRSMNVHNGFFKYDQLAHISEEQAEQLNNVIVEPGDVLINITGASVARSCIVPNDVLPARVNQHVSIVRIKEGCATPEYINNAFTIQSFQNQLLFIAGTGGATREAITKQQLEELLIPLPPMHLQVKFSKMYTKIEQQKALVRKAINETQTLFDSLMNQYFD